MSTVERIWCVKIDALALGFRAIAVIEQAFVADTWNLAAS